MKVQSYTSYMSSPTSSNSYNNPHTNMIYNYLNIEAKFMKTSDAMAWECKLFTHEFIGFRATENMVIKVKSHKLFMASKKSSNSDNNPHTNLI